MTQELDRVNHLAIPVSDIAKAVDWYASRFRCEVEYQDETWAMVRFRNLKIAFVLPKQHAGHVAFEVDDLASFGDVKTHRDGVRYVYLDDPFGNTVEAVPKE